jgi:hypothetical protein
VIVRGAQVDFFLAAIKTALRWAAGPWSGFDGLYQTGFKKYII